MTEFKAGDIVRAKEAYCLIQKGATAVVISPKDLEGSYMKVFWLDALSGTQNNGSYHPDRFELVYSAAYAAKYTENRAVTPVVEKSPLEDPESIEKTTETLRNAVEVARSKGLDVDCSVKETVLRRL